MNGRCRKLTLLALGGVFTAPHFMDEFRDTLKRHREEEGDVVAAATVMPYGDWTAPAVRQAAEVALDVLFPAFGGRRAAAEAARLCGDGDELALVGHSGGGVAAVHAAAALHRAGARVRAVVMIGSPKTPIPEPIRAVTAHLYCGDAAGRPRDPIARTGGWRGKPPACARSLELVGGHRDYFRSRPPYVNAEGASNLSITAEAVRAWLRETSGIVR